MRKALDRARERKASGSSATPIGDNGGRGAPRNHMQARRAKRLVLGSSKGAEARRLAVSNGCRLSAVLGASNEKGTVTKKGGRYGEPRVPVQEGRERQLCLARPRKLRRAGGYRPGGFHIGNLMIKGTGGSLKEKCLRCQGLFQPTRG
jgi:hypothetical protein